MSAAPCLFFLGKIIMKVNKYQELRSRLRTNKERGLMLVNDKEVRRQAFSETAKILKKIEKLNKECDAFNKKDQQLFNDWFNLTFQSDRKRYDETYQEYRSIATFHNDIVALAEMKNLSMKKAYAQIMEENHKFEFGTNKDREQIEKLRMKRRVFVQKATEAEESAFRNSHMDEDYDEFEVGEDENENDGDFDLNNIDTSRLDKDSKKFYNLFKEMPPKKLSKVISTEGFDFFMFAFSIAMEVQDTALVVKIWDAASAQMRKKISTQFARDMGVPLSDLIEEMRYALETLSDAKQKTGKDKDKEVDEDENDFEEASGAKGRDDQFIQMNGLSSKKINPQEETALKGIYRKLARLIHPDAHSVETKGGMREWYSQMWERLQDAYKKRDLEAMRRLEMVVIIGIEDLQSLTLDEIKGSFKIFERELQEVQQTTKAKRTHPAWKFSKKRSYDSLIKRVKKDFQGNLDPLLEEIGRLKEFHEYLKTSLRPGKLRKRAMS